jgi:GxxExxY protein
VRSAILTHLGERSGCVPPNPFSNKAATYASFWAGAVRATATGMTLELLHADITERILRVYYEVLNELGFGFLEDVFQTVMVIALRAAGLDVQQNVPIRVWFRGTQIGHFYADIVVNGVVLIELKTGAAIELRHEAQTLNCSSRISRWR